MSYFGHAGTPKNHVCFCSADIFGGKYIDDYFDLDLFTMFPLGPRIDAVNDF